MQLHAEARGALQSWLREVEVAHWDSAHEIQNLYSRAQLLPREVVVFLVLGDHFRESSGQLCGADFTHLRNFGLRSPTVVFSIALVGLAAGQRNFREDVMNIKAIRNERDYLALAMN
jgi:membrane protein required for beta-lactamase induction